MRTTEDKFPIRRSILEREMRRAVVDDYKELSARAGGLSPTSISECVKRGGTLRTISRIGTGLNMDDWKELLYPDDLNDLELSSRPDGAHRLPLCMSHRKPGNVLDRYYLGALASCESVLYISIMSKNSFDLVEKHLTVGTRLDVLTWMPSSTAEMLGFGKHEKTKFPKSAAEKKAKIAQVRGALKRWRDLAQDHKMRLRAYASTPTLQGVIVRGQWALIELLPFDTPTEERPALLMRADQPQELEAFKFFSKRFERLFRFARRIRLNNVKQPL